MSSPTIVEQTLRGQREHWQEITERVSRIPSHELPPEPPKRILLFGLGSSYFAAKLTAYALMRDRSRPRIPTVACSSLGVGSEVVPTKGDWAFAFSHRGQSKATLQAIDACDRAGAFTFLVCGQGVQAPEGVRFTLPTTPQEKVEPHTASVTGAICAVTTLLIGAKAVEEWDALRSIGDPDLDEFCRRAGKGPQILLGEWEGEWLAREGALKFMEMARSPVRAFSSEEYFHGPRHSVKEGDVIWHVALAKDPRAEEIQASHRLAVIGSSPLAWIPALVELQWLALAVAVNRGIDPDLR
jgi:fructoselysine-6-P-deglycase FrlB-like protein